MCLASTLALAVPAAAQTVPRYDTGTPSLQQIWVDPIAGDDRAGGRGAGDALRTVSEAWNRIPRNNAASPLSALGYEIVLQPGEYPAEGLPTYWEQRYGSASAPVVLRAAAGAGTAILRGGLNVAHVAFLYLIDLDVVPRPAGDAVHCEDCDHLLLRNVTLIGGVRPVNGVEADVAHETLKVNQSTYVYVEDSRISGADDNAIDFVAVQYGHIVRSRVFGATDWCAYVKGGSASILVDSNEFFDCGTGGFIAGQGTGLQFMTVPWVHYEAYGVRVVNNYVHDVDGAGLGVNGGFNVLLAWNTLVRVGSRSHLIEVGFGARSCDAADVATELAACQRRLDAGAWGTTAVDDGDNFVRIPNRHIQVLNNVVDNREAASGHQHFAVPGVSTRGADGPGTPDSRRADDDLRIAGNVIWDGPPEHALGLGEDAGCTDPHPGCGPTAVRASNWINTVEPAFRNLAAGDLRPTGALTTLSSVAVSEFAWEDLPSTPRAPAGDSASGVPADRDGRPRLPGDPPGASIAR